MAVVKALIKAGASVNANNNNFGTPLQVAAYYDAEAIGNFLLHAGANINHIDIDGDSALFSALYNGSQAMFKLLLSEGADYKIINKYGRNILHVAATFADIKMIQTLSQAGLQGVDTKAKDSKDRTSREFLDQRAEKSDGLVEAFELLLQSIRDVNNEARVKEVHGEEEEGYVEEVVRVVAQESTEEEEEEDEFVKALEIQEVRKHLLNYIMYLII